MLRIPRGLLVLSISLFTFQNLFSQSDYRQGYIITLTKDTIHGFISYKENASRYQSCTYRKELNSETIDYNPFQLSGYGFQNDRYYVSKEVMIDSVYENYFVEVLVKGKATLLQVKSRFFLEDSESNQYELTSVTVEIKNEKGRFVQTKELYKGILNWKFSDCQKISSEIKSLRLEERDLTKIFELYNSCFDFGQQSPKSSKPWSEIYVGISGGFFTSTLNDLANLSFYDNLNPDQFKKDMGLFGGLSFKFTFPRISERLNTNVDLIYKRGSHESLKQTSNYYETIFLEYTSFQIPVSFGYSFNTSRQRNKPTIELGANFDYNLNSSSYYQLDYAVGNVVTTEKEYNFVSVKKIAFSPFIGIGGYHELGKKMQVFARFRYQYGISNLDNTVLVVPQQSLNLILGVLMQVK